MASLERFQHQFDLGAKEYQGKSGDAIVDFYQTGDRLKNFVALEDGDRRLPFFIPERNRIYLPFGSVAGINLDDEEILLKHFRRRDEKEFGLVMFYIGGTIVKSHEGEATHYRMEDEEPYLFTISESYLSFEDFQARCKFLLR